MNATTGRGPPLLRHRERHRSQHVGWLRAAVLGANDGILSTGSLVIGVASAQAGRSTVVVTGVAGLVAGALSMAAGEYVSVSSQADTERADLEKEQRELATDAEHEHEELAGIYRQRGLTPELAKQVAEQLMAADALGAHARDELGLTDTGTARPVQAALASAVSFAVGAVLPVLVVLLAPEPRIVVYVAATSLVFLAALGALAAGSGGAGLLRGALRVTFWGAVAMGVTAGVGALFGTTVA